MFFTIYSETYLHLGLLTWIICKFYCISTVLYETWFIKSFIKISNSILNYDIRRLSLIYYFILFQFICIYHLPTFNKPPMYNYTQKLYLFVLLICYFVFFFKLFISYHTLPLSSSCFAPIDGYRTWCSPSANIFFTVCLSFYCMLSVSLSYFKASDQTFLFPIIFKSFVRYIHNMYMNLSNVIMYLISCII